MKISEVQELKEILQKEADQKWSPIRHSSFCNQTYSGDKYFVHEIDLMPRALFTVTSIKGSPRGYTGYFRGFHKNSIKLAKEIIITRDNEVYIDGKLHEADLDNGRDYIISIKRLSDYEYH